MEKDLLRVEEVAVLIGCNVKTLNNWYAFKKLEPENEYAKILPDFIQNGSRQTRYWNRKDIWKIIEFKQKIPKGRGGILACVTQKYYEPRKSKRKETINE